MSPDGIRKLPNITTHMLANDNWGGMIDKRILALKPLELIFLLPLRTVRRRWFSKRSGITFLSFSNSEGINRTIRHLHQAARRKTGRRSLLKTERP